MRVAIPYEGGKIFQHFGKTEVFKIYDIEDGKVISAALLDAEGSGHSAIAGFLAKNGVDIVICGGIGEHATEALAEAGMAVYTGVSGDADEAIIELLDDNLFADSLPNCHEHDEGGCGCGCGEEGGCGCGGDEEGGCGCGGGCGGCGGGAPRILYEGPNAGKNVKVHYTGTFNDGVKFDSSIDRGEPLAFICGVGMMIPGFDKVVATMEVGQAVDIHLMPEEAYGMPNPNAIFTIEIAELPGSEDLNVGDGVYLTNMMGQQFPVKVTAKNDTSITFDANHEMAGKELNFHIELVEVQE